MTNSASVYSGSWNFDCFAPQPNQDSDLLKQLGFIPGLKELLIIRQVHALEHATVWVMSELEGISAPSANKARDNETIGGLSTEKGFYLYGKLNPFYLRKAVRIALSRLLEGEWNLALHPRCGTNVSVAMMLTVGMVATAHILLPREPIGQLLGLGIASTTATSLAPELGMTVQKYLTTAIPFNLKIDNISKTADMWGRPAYFVSLKWH